MLIDYDMDTKSPPLLPGQVRNVGRHAFSAPIVALICCS